MLLTVTKILRRTFCLDLRIRQQHNSEIRTQSYLLHYASDVIRYYSISASIAMCNDDYLRMVILLQKFCKSHYISLVKWSIWFIKNYDWCFSVSVRNMKTKHSSSSSNIPNITSHIGNCNLHLNVGMQFENKLGRLSWRKYWHPTG